MTKKRRIWEVSIENPGERKSPPLRISSKDLGKTIDEWSRKVEEDKSSDREYFGTIRSRVIETK